MLRRTCFAVLMTLVTMTYYIHGAIVSSEQAGGGLAATPDGLRGSYVMRQTADANVDMAKAPLLSIDLVRDIQRPTGLTNPTIVS